MAHAMTFGVLALAVLSTSFISGILGMAGGMILMGILLLMMPLSSAMMLHGVVQMASNAWRAWLWRQHIDWRILRGTALGAVVALAVFSVLQLSVSVPLVLIALGLTPFISYVLPANLQLNVDKPRHPFTCGVVCVALQLLSGVSGPLLDIYFLRSRLDRRAVIATKAAFQTIGHSFKILYFGVLLSRNQGSTEWWVAAVMMALAVVGTTLSRGVLERMSDTDFRSWTRKVVTAAGVYYLASGVWAFV